MRPPIVDFPNWSSNTTHYSDLLNLDIKVPGEHTIRGESFDAEIQMLHIHLEEGRMGYIGIPIRAQLSGFNMEYQALLDQFQIAYNKDLSDCSRNQLLHSLGSFVPPSDEADDSNPTVEDETIEMVSTTANDENATINNTDSVLVNQAPTEDMGGGVLLNTAGNTSSQNNESLVGTTIQNLLPFFSVASIPGQNNTTTGNSTLVGEGATGDKPDTGNSLLDALVDAFQPMLSKQNSTGSGDISTGDGNSTSNVEQSNTTSHNSTVDPTHNRLLQQSENLRAFDPYADFMKTIFFYRYHGSNTEPPCFPITWFVMSAPLVISFEQLQQTKELIFTHVDGGSCRPTSVHNAEQSVARPLQPLGIVPPENKPRQIMWCKEGDYEADIV